MPGGKCEVRLTSSSHLWVLVGAVSLSSSRMQGGVAGFRSWLWSTYLTPPPSPHWVAGPGRDREMGQGQSPTPPIEWIGPEGAGWPVSSFLAHCPQKCLFCDVRGSCRPGTMVNDLFGKVYLSSKVLLSTLNSCVASFSLPASGFQIHPGRISLSSHDFARCCFIFPLNLPQSPWIIVTVPLDLLAVGGQR